MGVSFIGVVAMSKGVKIEDWINVDYGEKKISLVLYEGWSLSVLGGDDGLNVVPTVIDSCLLEAKTIRARPRPNVVPVPAEEPN